MSGHSKWSNIKRKKQAQDRARAKLFGRLSREIMAAVREGGDDPDANPRLRTAIENAKAENMPKENIQRAIRRGTGEIPGAVIEDATYEGYGPSGVAMLVQCTTDNKNRTVSEIRKIFDKHGGSLGEANSVAYMFRQVGRFLIDAERADEDELLMVALEAGAEDMSRVDGFFEIITDRSDFDVVADAFKEHDIPTRRQQLAMVPNNHIRLDGPEAERARSLIDTLEDHDDVQNVWNNLDVDPSAAGGSDAEAVEPAARAG